MSASTPPLPKRLLYALLPACALLLLCELTLLSLHVGARPHPIARGFSRTARYLIPDPQHPGAFLTQMYDGESDEKRIPPKTHARRILLFGGSNTEGFPHDYLQTLLNARLPANTPPYEVLNLGRRGYGSSRIAILFEQAMALEPDICLFYEGHNEFVELGFEQELAESTPAAARTAIALASHLRTFNSLVDLLRAPHTSPADALPTKHQWEYDRFRTYTYDQTLTHLERFRDNTSFMCTLAREHHSRMLLVTAIGNMLVSPFASNPPPNTPPATAARIERLLQEARNLFPERYRPLWSRGWQDHIHLKDWTFDPTPLPPDFHEPVLRANFLPGKPDTPCWPPPLTWSPKLRDFLSMLERFHHRELSPAERTSLDAARALLEQLLTLCPNHARALYGLGTCAYLQGDDARAAELLRAAARYDCAPRKASDLTNDMLRDIAHAQPDIWFYDAEKAVREASPSGIIGYELMLDECHLHERARPMLMQKLALFLIEQESLRKP